MQKSEEYIIDIYKAGLRVGTFTAREAHDYLSDVLTPSTTLPVEVPPVVVKPEPDKPVPTPEQPNVPNVFGKVNEPMHVQLPDFGAPYDLSDLPAGGLRWDGATRTIYGIPAQAAAREMSIKNASGVLATFGLSITASKPVWPDRPSTDNINHNAITDWENQNDTQ